MNELLYLRNLEKIIFPKEFTYFNHCTYYIPDSIKQRMVNGKYITGWSSIPIDKLTIRREMSFVERKSRIDSCLCYGNKLSKTSIIYNLADYAKPFIIRVIMPKRSFITKDNINDPYIKDLYKIYSGLGDGRHEKLPSKTNLLPFASSQVDEMSGKKIDIIYCIREIDLNWYASLVKETLEFRKPKEFVLPDNVDRNSNFEFLDGDLMLERDLDFSRYISDNNKMSDFEQEYYDEYSEFINKYTEGEILLKMSHEDHYLLHKMFENTYVTDQNIKK